MRTWRFDSFEAPEFRRYDSIQVRGLMRVLERGRMSTNGKEDTIVGRVGPRADRSRHISVVGLCPAVRDLSAAPIEIQMRRVRRQAAGIGWLLGIGIIAMATGTILLMRGAGSYAGMLFRRAAAQARAAAGALFRGLVLLIAGGGALTFLGSVLWGAAWLIGLVS
jgi:hypothetical protein